MSATGGSGEKPGHREAMLRVQKRLVEGGTPPRDAARLARESMLRVHESEKRSKPR